LGGKTGNPPSKKKKKKVRSNLKNRSPNAGNHKKRGVLDARKRQKVVTELLNQEPPTKGEVRGYQVTTKKKKLSAPLRWMQGKGGKGKKGIRGKGGVLGYGGGGMERHYREKKKKCRTTLGQRGCGGGSGGRLPKHPQIAKTGRKKGQ